MTTADFAAYRDERLKTIKPVSLKRDLGTVRHLFEIAATEWGLPLKENPIDRLNFKARDRRRERRLRDGEWSRLIEAATFQKNQFIAPIIKFAVETGMRRGEILSVLWEHYRAPQRVLVIPDSKNGRPRTIPLSRPAVEILAALPTTKGRVFPIATNAFRLAWDRAISHAALEDLHFHDLRHEAISRFFEAGLTTPEVALMSGHRDPRMLFRYAHAELRSVSDKLGTAR